MSDFKLIYILNHFSKNSHTHFYHVLNLLEKLTKEGVEIALVIEKCDDLPIINNKKIEVFAQNSQFKYLRPWELLKILFFLNKKGYKHIFVRISWLAAVVSIIASFFTKQKTFYWLSGQGIFEYYANLPFGFRKLRVFFTTRIPFIFIKTFIYRFVTGPESMKEYFVNEGRVNPKKIEILYNDIDLSRFKYLSKIERNVLKKELGYHENENIILYVKRLSPIKGVLYYFPKLFLDTLNKLPNDYLFVIIGDGQEKEKLETIIAQNSLNKRVRVLGSIPNKDVQNYYQIANIFINPTLEEGFPRVLIEAMACGLPLVTTNAGGIKDIVGVEQSHYMVDKNDRNAFAEKLIELASSDITQKMLREENCKTVQRFSTNSVALMYKTKIFS